MPKHAKTPPSPPAVLSATEPRDHGVAAHPDAMEPAPNRLNRGCSIQIASGYSSVLRLWFVFLYFCRTFLGWMEGGFAVVIVMVSVRILYIISFGPSGGSFPPRAGPCCWQNCRKVAHIWRSVLTFWEKGLAACTQKTSTSHGRWWSVFYQIAQSSLGIQAQSVHPMPAFGTQILRRGATMVHKDHK